MTDQPRRRKRYVAEKTASMLPTNATSKSARPKRATATKVPVVEAAAPAVHVEKKTADRIVSRFQNLLPDIEGLTDKIIETDLDHTQAIEVQSKVDDLVDWAPNVITWCADSRFLGMRPFAKQAEVLLNIFEDYCPRCTEKDYFKDIPVLDSIERVLAHVALLENGVCPHCRFTKRMGREKGLFKDPTEFLGVFGQRSGKCVVGDTEVFDGVQRRQVKDLVGLTFNVLTKNKNHRIGYEEATAFPSGTKACVRLTLQDGSAVTLSTDHPVFTGRGWVQVGMLLPTDLVATPRFIPEPDVCLEIPDEEVTLAAYLLADGGVNDSTAKFTNVTDGVIKDFYRVANTLGDGSRNVYKHTKIDAVGRQQVHDWCREGMTKQAVATKLGVRVETIYRILKNKPSRAKQGVVPADDQTFRARGLQWFRRKWGIYGLAKNKRLPAAFWSLSDRQICLFLNAFWACDGYIEKNDIGITLASERMIDDLKFLLLRLGIRSSKKFRWAKCQTGTFPAWRLTCYGKDAIKFLRTVGPILGKEEVGERLVAKLEALPRNTTWDVVPLNRKELKEVAAELKAATGKAHGYAVREFTAAKDVGYISLAMLASMADHFNYRGKYSWLLETDLVWEKIDSITPAGTLPVFDLSVPETGCFVGNNVVLHNTAVVSQAMSYLMHRNLHLTSPWKTYGLMPGQIIDFTVVATTRDQAEKTLWGTFKGVVENSPWFRAYKDVVNEEGKRHGVRDTIKMGETFLWFGHKSLIMYFAANNPSGLRGTTRFGGAIDELAWFDSEMGSQKVRANGPETYAALSHACLTLRQRVDEEHHKDRNCLWPMPLMFCTSSPRAMNDAIMTLYREKATQKRVVRRHWATWEAHPKNTKAALESLGELSGPMSARDYGAQPPITDDPLMPRLHMIVDAFKTPLSTDKKYGPIIVPSAVGYVEDLDVKSGKKLLTYLTAGLEDTAPTPAYEPLRNLKESALDALGPLRETFEDLLAKPPAKRNHVMGVDLGVTNNAMAIVCGYLSTDGSKFITDFVLEVKPTRNRSVNIADVYEELIIALVERLNVVGVYYDTWSSVHQLQDLSARYGSLGPLNSKVERRAWLREHQYEETTPAFIADQYTFVMADALMLVSRLEQGDCLFPALEVGVMELLVNKRLDPQDHPYAHLALQMATVRARGNRLLKPISGDDDLFRAWANAAVKAFTDEMLIEMLKLEGRSKPPKASTISGYVSLGMGGGKGIRRTETLGRSALSSSGVPGMPIVSRKGAFRG